MNSLDKQARNIKIVSFVLVSSDISKATGNKSETFRHRKDIYTQKSMATFYLVLTF